MIHNLDQLVKDLTPVVLVLAPLISSLAVYLKKGQLKEKPKSRKRKRKPQGSHPEQS